MLWQPFERVCGAPSPPAKNQIRQAPKPQRKPSRNSSQLWVCMELSKLAEAQSLLFALRETTLESFGLDLFFDWTPSWPSLKMELFLGFPKCLCQHFKRQLMGLLHWIFPFISDVPINQMLRLRSTSWSLSANIHWRVYYLVLSSCFRFKAIHFTTLLVFGFKEVLKERGSHVNSMIKTHGETLSCGVSGCGDQKNAVFHKHMYAHFKCRDSKQQSF